MQCEDKECVEFYNREMKLLYEDYYVGYDPKEEDDDYDSDYDYFHCSKPDCHEIVLGKQSFICSRCDTKFCLNHLELDHMYEDMCSDCHDIDESSQSSEKK